MKDSFTKMTNALKKDKKSKKVTNMTVTLTALEVVGPVVPGT
jgi:hypothetical protein